MSALARVLNNVWVVLVYLGFFFLWIFTNLMALQLAHRFLHWLDKP